MLCSPGPSPQNTGLAVRNAVRVSDIPDVLAGYLCLHFPYCLKGCMERLQDASGSSHEAASSVASTVTTTSLSATFTLFFTRGEMKAAEEEWAKMARVPINDEEEI
ncbi:hypothetical protein EYF80_002601 [Liparis tanakae]|uniref:Uncharacterized protein n=1 Tax=Liparis tanakae TaxID=230148 RepID=A0A4Z2JBA1_9TELE|nr:hypothetical protein EYF80_002601 [Liparis tanakae]